jgi:hypothetical protein
MKRSFLLLLLLVSQFGFSQKIGCQAGKSNLMPPPYYCAENLRSDTFDILKYTISLEVGNTFTPTIKGNTAIRFAPRMNNKTYIRFDLLKLTIDSVKEGLNLLTYTYNDTILKVNFLAPMNTVDTTTFTVYYKGPPQLDPSWGGFYFTNLSGVQYAYNLGVGFTSSPHNFGRVWFPCFDNFVEHSKYEFFITNDSARRAYCNGVLMSDVVTGAKRTRNWVMNKEIVSYLASVSVAQYKQVNWNVNAQLGNLPIKLVAAAADTTPMKNGFVNLTNCILGFENYFGPYKWNRVGYCLVPFNSGAMEHATNISYPKIAAGNLGYEAEIMAHELSHHWWGDLITCKTKEDMWINEGMATFSSYMFLEWKYGKSTYLASIRSEHEPLVHHLHHKEGGFRAISGVPHNLTYGDYVYKKGADMAHTLRGYMGDAAFFAACKYVMQQKEGQNINSIEMRDLMQTSSGQNLVPFFDNWILNPGWAGFAIDSVKYVGSGPTYSAVVSLRQKLLGAPSLFTNVPLELAFFKSDWTKSVQTVTLSGATGNFTVTVPFMPVYCGLNYDSKISDATAAEIKVIKAPGVPSMPLTKMNITVTNAGSDSTLLRIVHHYIAPDPFKLNPLNHKISDQRYWKVEGIRSAGFHASAKFNFDGNKTQNTNGWLDTLLMPANADSLRLFYRKDAKDDWKLVMNIVKAYNFKVGWIQVDTLKNGEYAFGNSTDTTNVISVKENFSVNFKAGIFPNPAKNFVNIDLAKTPVEKLELTVLDIEGKLIEERELTAKTNQIDISKYLAGAYVFYLRSQGELVYSSKFVKE